MKPDEFWNITLTELGEMVMAIYEDRNRTFDTKMDITAWQTALLMNSSGNYKKKITPEMLLKRGNGEDKKPKSRRLEEEEKAKLVKDLLSKFE